MATKKNEKSSSVQDTSRDDALLNAPFHDLDSFEIETLLEEVNVLDLEGYLFTFDPKNKGVRTGLHKIDVAGTKTEDVRMNLLPKRRLQSSFFFLVALFTFYDLPVAIAQEGEPSLSVSQQEIAELKELLALAKQERIDAAVEGNKTGNDPRDFSLKWTPFYRYTKLENGLTQQDLTAFGTVPFSRRLGVLFEVPVAQYRDFSDVPGFLPGTDAIGIGDISLKFVHNPEALGFTYGKDGEKSGSILLGADFVLPTATDDALAGDALLFAPIVGVVLDMPFHGFFAMLNLYYFDVYKKDSAPDTSRYVGRWFYMQPLSRPGPWWGGLYLMPEFQPIYDFETDEFSAWIGLEFGKMFAPGRIGYIKPGWGINNSELVDRDDTFEVGFRWFF